MKQILCFGDSNTHGFIPENRGRLPYDQRWPGILAERFHGKVHIIDEGHSGRTTAMEDPTAPYRSGLDFIGSCLECHKPLDGIIIMLGTNDCKTFYGVSVDTIAANLEKIVCRIKVHDQTVKNNTKIIIAPPVPMDERVDGVWNQDKSSIEKSRQLSAAYEAVAKREGVYFVDPGQWGVELTWDGCHYSAAGHLTFADRMEQYLTELFEL